MQIEYNHHLPEFERLLESIDRPGDYCDYCRLLAMMPRLEVESVGTIAFPVQEAQIKSLIRAAERAPYGKGPDTVLDRSVRDCWQIDADKLSLGGRGWEDSSEVVLRHVADGIGCPFDRLVARPYKLLIYEPGGFFTPHRDTEKAAGMIATLVISLPTDGVGGELVVRHKGREMVIDMCVSDPSELVYAAFYADCTHETRPVREGHRVALVYNLILDGSRSSALQRAPDFDTQATAIAEELVDWARGTQPGDKIVWILDHDYSEAGISFAAFKGIDAVVGRTLSEAAKRAECALHAAVVEITEVGSGEYGGYYDDLDDVDIGEVQDSTASLYGWVAPDDERPEFGRIPMLDEELLPQGVFDDVEPDEKDVEEASGNAGVSVEHTYRRSALVAWPLAGTVAVLSQGDLGSAIKYVTAEIAQSSQERDPRSRQVGLLSQLIDAWIPTTPYLRPVEHPALRSMFELLTDASEADLTARFMRTVLVRRYAGTENDGLVKMSTKAGPAAMDGFLPKLVEAKLLPYPAGVLGLVWRLTERHWAGGNAGWPQVLEPAAVAVFETLPRALEPPADKITPSWNRPNPAVLSAEAVCDLFSLCWYLGFESHGREACRLIVGHPKQATPDRVLPEALRKARARGRDFADSASYRTLWLRASKYLLARSDSPPRKRQDWLVAARLSCPCSGCRQLQAFCNDPASQTARITVAQGVRQHLRQGIDSRGLDIEYRTERRGRPYTLICTKNRASFHRRVAEYDEDISQMRSLIGSAPSQMVGAQVARLRNAVLAGKQMLRT